MTQSVVSSMHFLLEDPLYLKEKVYEYSFQPPEGVPRSNLLLERFENLHIEDIRGREQSFRFEQDGFCILNFDTSMSYEDFEDPDKVTTTYSREVAQALKRHLGAARVQIFDYNLRKRETHFPICTGEFYKYRQPSTICHVDTTPAETARLLCNLNPTESDTISNQHHQYVNLWRALRGPVRDWPLAVCDPKTVSATDLQPRDLVNTDDHLETYQVHRRPEHKWYYLRDQMPNETWCFLQSDSRQGAMLGVPHSSFANPLSKEGDLPRESIEIRALILYGDKESAIEGTQWNTSSSSQ